MSGFDLKVVGFLKLKGGVIRWEKFKNWVECMDICFDFEVNCEVFVYKRIGKIIVFVEDFEVVVSKVYLEGYYDVKKIFFLVRFLFYGLW